ncbi:MAG: hypothetical protein HPY84_04105 [Syntrophobacteraceae bacterium]|nr:hypothetical protein [Syntrophobacteraceae bacterium]
MILGNIPIIGQVVGKVIGLIDKVVEDKDQASRLKHDLQIELLNRDFSFIEKEIDARAQIIAAEARGKSRLQRNWRPLLMLTFTYIIAHNYIISPMFSLPRLDIPPDMWELLKLGMGGYIVGRSIEKGVEAWRKQDPT